MRLRVTRVLAAAAVLALAFAFAADHARASFVGDLVFCDTNDNGLYEPASGDYGLNGIGVGIECRTPTNAVCFAASTASGTLHPSAAVQLGLFQSLCTPPLNWNPLGDTTGRYLFEVLDTCRLTGGGPWTCRVTVDQSDAPADCPALGTPRAEGPPADGNLDGDFCDAEDGPFPEGQTLGNQADSSFSCEARPDPAPGDGTFTVIIDPVFDDDCSIGNDFGFTPHGRGITRTPGFWRNRPRVIDGSIDGGGGVPSLLPFTFCGQVVDQACEAVALMRRRGGGVNAFSRHAVAAILNCRAFGNCPATVMQLVNDGSAACAAGASFGFGAAADVLAAFNQSGDDLALPFNPGKAQPKYCE
jgi:hypothetical protein